MCQTWTRRPTIQLNFRPPSRKRTAHQAKDHFGRTKRRRPQWTTHQRQRHTHSPVVVVSGSPERTYCVLFDMYRKYNKSRIRTFCFVREKPAMNEHSSVTWKTVPSWTLTQRSQSLFYCPLRTIEESLSKLGSVNRP